MSIVELKNVNTIYEGEKFPTIEDIDLDIEKGEFVSIMGPNGSGKTTLLETINGLLVPERGQVTVFGENIGNDGEKARKKIGYLLQNFSFNPTKSFLVKDVVMMGRTGKIGVLNSIKDSDWDFVHECMELVEVEKFADKPIGKLSGGEQQKVMLARALAQDPDILLLDEPFTNLDYRAEKELKKLIKKIYEEKDLTLMMVTHSLDSVPEESSKLVLMDGGRIVLQGKPEEVIESEKWKSVYGLEPEDKND